MEKTQVVNRSVFTVQQKLLDGVCSEHIGTISFALDQLAHALTKKAVEIRKAVMEMIAAAKSGHIGGCFSAADLLTVLYYYKMHLNLTDPNWADRDRFILSKGHAAPLLYAILIDLGFLGGEELFTLRKIGSRLQGHPNILTTPGVDISSGSLGMGLSAGCGIALAAKLDNKVFKTYVMLGDGELQEGQVWEAVMTAAHFRLNNLVAIVDKNNLQTDSPVKSVLNCGEIAEQFKAFGWNIIQIDGHNIREIMQAFDLLELSMSKPTVIIAETCKGKGVSFMEHNPTYHGTPPGPEEKALGVYEINHRHERGI